MFKRSFSQFSFHAMSIFFVPGLFGLTACYAPVQNFEVGGELWQRSNPEWIASDSPRFSVPKRVKVAVLDGGVDYNHPRLRGHLVPFVAPAVSGRAYGIGYDLLGGPNDFFPHFSILNPTTGEDLSEMYQVREHGTHVSGLATLGHPEVALLPIRVLPLPENPAIAATPEEALLNPEIKARFCVEAVKHVGRGIALACQQGAQVLNLSLGIDLSELDSAQQDFVKSSLTSGILDPIRYACSGSLLVVAAGNESREIDELKYSLPVTLEERNILGVGALREHHRTAYYSNQGRFVDVFMRGSNVRSSVPSEGAEGEGATGLLSGTSMATPLVSHLAARVLLESPELGPLEVRALILNTATLEELDLEALPEESKRHAEREGTPLALFPSKRLGLVVNFKRALEAARKLHRNASDLSLEAKNERARLLTPPFEHGHSPF